MKNVKTPGFFGLFGSSLFYFFRYIWVFALVALFGAFLQFISIEIIGGEFFSGLFRALSGFNLSLERPFLVRNGDFFSLGFSLRVAASITCSLLSFVVITMMVSLLLQKIRYGEGVGFVDLYNSIKISFSKLFAVVFTWLCFLFIIFVVLMGLFTLLSFFMFSALAFSLTSLFSFICVYYFVIKYSFFVNAVALKGLSGMSALNYSAKIIKGRFVRYCFYCFLAPFLLYFVVFLIFLALIFIFIPMASMLPKYLLIFAFFMKISSFFAILLIFLPFFVFLIFKTLFFIDIDRGRF